MELLAVKCGRGSGYHRDSASWIATLCDVNGKNSVGAFPASLQNMSPSFRNVIFEVHTSSPHEKNRLGMLEGLPLKK